MSINEFRRNPLSQIKKGTFSLLNLKEMIESKKLEILHEGGRYPHVKAVHSFWGYLVKGPTAFDNSVFTYHPDWTETPVTVLPGRYQKREVWEYQYDHMPNTKLGDAISALVVLVKYQK